MSKDFLDARESSFVFIEFYGVPAESFGWIFGVNALGLIAASQINRRLLASHAADAILRATVHITLVMGAALWLVAWLETGGMFLLLVPLFGFVASLGLTQPNALAGALAGHGQRAGAASALMGAVQFGAATLAGSVVGAVHDGSALPMASVMAICAAASCLTFRWLVSTTV